MLLCLIVDEVNHNIVDDAVDLVVRAVLHPSVLLPVVYKLTIR